MQNKPKVKIGKMNVTSLRTMNYEQRTMNDEKNKPKQTQIKLEAQRRSLRVSFLESSNRGPISIGPLTPQEIAFRIVGELVKIRRLGDTAETNYTTIDSSKNLKE